MFPKTNLLLKYIFGKKACVLSLALIGTGTIYAQAENCTAPATPLINSTGITYLNAAWQPVEGAAGYEWRIAGSNGQTVDEGSLQGTTLLLQNLTPRTEYQVSVRTVCSEGNYSEWSTTQAETFYNRIVTTAQIGNGTEWALSLYGPILYTGSTLRQGSVSNMLFTQQELQAAGIPQGADITAVAFNKLSNAGTENNPPVEMTFYAANSDKTAPLDINTTLADVQASHTQVMQNLEYALPSEIGWVTFDFDAPFVYDGRGLEIGTYMHHEPYVTNNNSTFFSSFVAWEYTSGYKQYLIGAWPLPGVNLNAPETVVLNHMNGTGQYNERPNIKISYNYAASLESVLISVYNNAEATITNNNGTLQLSARVNPAMFGQMVLWQITEGSDFATVDANGLITALDNGLVKIRATSVEDDAFFGELEVSISNQLSCEQENPGSTDPITLVQFADIDNTSATEAGSGSRTEDFTAITGNVTIGEEYTLTVKGNTNGNFVHNVTAYIDWDHNNTFSENETYSIGALENTTGADNTVVTSGITVPDNALTGNTVLRIVKQLEANALPCNTNLYGQTEYYTLNVSSPTAGQDEISATTVTIYPNPVKTELTVSASQAVKSVQVYNSIGQKILTANSAIVNLTALSSGIYIVKTTLDNGNEQVHKVVKE